MVADKLQFCPSSKNQAECSWKERRMGSGIQEGRVLWVMGPKSSRLPETVSGWGVCVFLPTAVSAVCPLGWIGKKSSQEQTN